MKIFLCTRTYRVEAEDESEAVDVLREGNEIKFLQDENWTEAEVEYYPQAIVRDYNGEDLIPCGETPEMNDWYDPGITGNAPIYYRWLKDTEGFQIFVPGNIRGKWQYAQSIDFDFLH